MNPMSHLIIAPILLPLLTAALMLMLGEKHRPLKARLNLEIGRASCRERV